MVTRRNFLGWQLGGIMTATVVVLIAPLAAFCYPAPPKGQKKGPITVALSKSIDDLADGDAIKFDAPKDPNSAFIMADGGGDNSAGDLAFGGFVVKNGGDLHVFAINCSHLGCSVAINSTDKSFDCPCHGSRFHLDGTVLRGPAPVPLSHLTWQKGGNPTTILVDGLILGV
jgi:Rieske Fe-S protein